MKLHELPSFISKHMSEKCIKNLEDKDFWYTQDISEMAILCCKDIKMYNFIPVNVGRGIGFFENSSEINQILVDAVNGEYGKIDSIRKKLMAITKNAFYNKGKKWAQILPN